MTQSSITLEDTALYDRQIRLWGLESQIKIQKSSILLVNCNLLGSEIAKNLVLAGIKKLTIQGDCLYDLQKLNPSLDLVFTESISQENYDLIILIQNSFAIPAKFQGKNTLVCYSMGEIGFYSTTDIFPSIDYSGMSFKKFKRSSDPLLILFDLIWNYSFADWQTLVEAKKKLCILLNLNPDYISDEQLKKCLEKRELAPCCAILGGFVAQQAIQMLTQVSKPTRFWFDGGEATGVII